MMPSAPTPAAALGCLAIGAHPDDVELTVGGTLLLARSLGKTTRICHMTAGELGTRGSAEIRRREAAAAAQALGSECEILGLADGHVVADDAAIGAVARLIRRLRPEIILAPYTDDLHPDHEATGNIVRKAAFLSGVAKYDAATEPWRPARVLYYMSHTLVEAQLLVDISPFFEEKRAAAMCYRSQFFAADSAERETYISRPEFWTWWEARHAHFGNPIGARYAEAFHLDGPVPTRNPFDLFTGFGKYRNT